MASTSSGCAVPPRRSATSKPERPSLWRNLFGADLRSLALFRVALGLLILNDVFVRSTNLRMFYTDFGVLPRGIFIEYFLNPNYFSLHMMNGSTFFISVLFVLHGLVALGFLVGYRTKLMTFLIWLFVISLHSRNGIILQGGDTYTRVLLFWSLFLPLGARYSIDHALDSSEEKSSNQVLSVGSIGLLMQIMVVYMFSAAYKWKGSDWHDGSAIMYALNLDIFTTPLGRELLRFPALLKTMTPSVLWFEALGTLLFFIPIFVGPVRTLTVALFLSLHAGFLLCMNLGHFPYVCAAAVLALLPTWFWNHAQRLRAKSRHYVRIYYDTDCGFCLKAVLLIKEFFLLSYADVQPAQADEQAQKELKKWNSWIVVDEAGARFFKFEAMTTVFRHSPILFWLVPFMKLSLVTAVGNRVYDLVAAHRPFFSKWTNGLAFRTVSQRSSVWAQMFAVICFVAVPLWNYADLVQGQYLGPMWLHRLTQMVRLDQVWDTFSPNPLKDDGWYVVPGKLRDGTQVDLFTGGGPVRWEKPVRVSDQYKNSQEQKYFVNLSFLSNSDYRLYYGQYLCRDWNEGARYPGQLMSFEIDFMMERTRPDGTVDPVKKLNLWNHDCFAE